MVEADIQHKGKYMTENTLYTNNVAEGTEKSLTDWNKAEYKLSDLTTYSGSLVIGSGTTTTTTLPFEYYSTSPYTINPTYIYGQPNPYITETNDTKTQDIMWKIIEQMSQELTDLRKERNALQVELTEVKKSVKRDAMADGGHGIEDKSMYCLRKEKTPEETAICKIAVRDLQLTAYKRMEDVPMTTMGGFELDGLFYSAHEMFVKSVGKNLGFNFGQKVPTPLRAEPVPMIEQEYKVIYDEAPTRGPVPQITNKPKNYAIQRQDGMFFGGSMNGITNWVGDEADAMKFTDVEAAKDYKHKSVLTGEDQMIHAMIKETLG